MSRITRAFCCSHALPLFDPPIPYTLLCPRPLGTDHEIVIDDCRFGPDVDGSSLAEYAQLFALARSLAAGDIVADRLFLFQFRKFLSPFAEAGAPANAPWLRVLRPGEVAGAFPSAEVLSATPSRLLVGGLQDLGMSVAAHYAAAHVVDDLVMFAAACAESGHVDPADVRSLATMRGFVPSPALCLIEAELFVRAMAILESVWDRMRASYHVRRTGYQRRVAGYLLERLHSVILCRWLMDGAEPDIHVWQRFVVLPD